MKVGARVLIPALFGLAVVFAEGAWAGTACVPFARAISAVKLTGDAWSWWDSAAGRYHRSAEPSLGAVLVMKRTARLRRGHVAVVSGVLGPREILIDHANWSPGAIERGARAIDVSPDNDWSEVRVWHGPSDAFGVTVYPAYGFIHPYEPGLDDAPVPAAKPAVFASREPSRRR